MLKSAGTDAKDKITNAFYANHPHISKRQVELKIDEIAIKRRDDACKKICWYVQPDFEKYLDMENFENGTPTVPKMPVKPTSSSKKEKIIPAQREDSSSAANPKATRQPRESDTTTTQPSMPKKLEKVRYFHTQNHSIAVKLSSVRFLSLNLFLIPNITYIQIW